MELSECERKGFIKKAVPSISLVKSLLEISETKQIAMSSAKIDETTINAYLPMAYDSLREILEALCTLHGYKVTNHVCLGELLRKLESDFDYTSFDRFRYIRNGINYYGRRIDFTQGKEIISKINAMRKNIILKIEARIKK